MHFLWFIVVQIASCDDSDTRAEFLSFSFEARKFWGSCLLGLFMDVSCIDMQKLEKTGKICLFGLSMDVSFIDMQRQEKTGKSYLLISFKSVLGRSCTNFFFQISESR